MNAVTRYSLHQGIWTPKVALHKWMRIPDLVCPLGLLAILPHDSIKFTMVVPYRLEMRSVNHLSARGHNNRGTRFNRLGWHHQMKVSSSAK
jgi:hypothetical protein